jgi:hypothetical protein
MLTAAAIHRLLLTRYPEVAITASAISIKIKNGWTETAIIAEAKGRAEVLRAGGKLSRAGGAGKKKVRGETTQHDYVPMNRRRMPASMPASMPAGHSNGSLPAPTTYTAPTTQHKVESDALNLRRGYSPSPVEIGRMEADKSAMSRQLETQFEAQARKERALADKNELLVLQLRGEQAPIEAVKSWFSDVIVRHRDTLMNMSEELQDRLAVEDNPVKCREMVESECNKALHILSDYATLSARAMKGKLRVLSAGRGKISEIDGDSVDLGGADDDSEDLGAIGRSKPVQTAKSAKIKKVVRK